LSIIKRAIYSDPLARVITALLCLSSVWFSASFLLWKLELIDSGFAGMAIYIGAFIGSIFDFHLFNYGSV